MRTSRSSVLVDLALAGALFLIAWFVFHREALHVPFHGDESEWINASRYFKYLVLDRDTDGEVWRPSFITRDQPPLGRYVIGGLIWALGNDPMAVNRSYAWARDRETNEREGRVPGPHLLQPVRQMMALFGAGAVVCLYVVGRILDGRISGVVAGLFVTSSPLVQLYFSQARSEAMLAFLSGLGLIGVLIVALRFATGRSIWPIGLLAGVALGLALATKLTAALAVLGSIVYGTIATVSRGTGDVSTLRRMGLWTLATIVSVGIVFVGTNPFLWPNPLGRATSMLDQQRSIMVDQGGQFGGVVVAEPAEKVWIVVERTFVRNATPSFDEGLPRESPPVVRRTFLNLPDFSGISLELVLATVGLVVVSWRAARGWCHRQLAGPEVALLCWLVAYFFGIAGNLTLDWPRYYVPTAYLGSILIGIGTAGIVRAPFQARSRRVLAPAPRRRRSVGSVG